MTKLLQVIGVLAVGGLVASACSSSGGDQTGKGGTTGTAGTTGAAGHGGATGTGGGAGTGGTGGSVAGAGGTGGSAGAAGGTTGTAGGGGTTGAGGTSGAAGTCVTGTGGGAGTTGAGGAAGTTGAGGAAGAAGTTGAGGAAGAAGHGGGGAGGNAGGGGNAGTGGAAGGAGTGGAAGGAGTGGAAGAAGQGGGGSGGGGGNAGTTGSAGAGGAGGTGGAPAPACADFPSNATGSTSFTVTSSEYASCTPIPDARTCNAKPFPMGSSPAITWTAGPSGTMSYAVVFKDLSVLARYASTDPNYNKGFHYVMWDIPADKRGLPANMMGGHLSTDIPGARQWSNFNNYGWFGPCPNFDPTMPTTYTDSYAFIVYALPTAKTVVPAQMMGVSNVRLLDNAFKAVALATAEYRGTSNAASSGIPAGILPPTPKPPCATDGSALVCGCLTGP